MNTERFLIGLLVSFPEEIYTVSEFLSPEDFESAFCRDVYETILKIMHRGEKYDLLIIQHENQNLSVDDLVDCISEVQSYERAEKYALIVKEESEQRKIKKIASKIISSKEKSDVLKSMIFQISESGNDSGIIDMSQALGDFVQDFSSDPKKYKTGIQKIDGIFQGFEPGDLAVIAARPSMGKTAMMLQMALNMLAEGKCVGMFSLEMKHQKILRRMMMNVTDMNKHRLAREENSARFSQGISILEKYKFYIDKVKSINLPKIYAKATKMKRQYGIEILFIDYLQLMEAEKNTGNRNQDISDITRGLKILALTLDIPIVVLSQLSRKVEERSDKRPILSDLRDSGAIEQDADIVAMLYRDDYYKTESNNGLSEIEIDFKKSREDGKAFTTCTYNMITQKIY